MNTKRLGLACGRLDTDAGGNAGDHDLRDTQVPQVLLQARVPERPPLPFGDRVVSRLLVQLGDQIGPTGRSRSTAASLLRASRGCTADIDEHNRQAMAAERLRQEARVLDDFLDRVHFRESKDAFCRSITTRAVLGSRVVSTIVFSFWQAGCRGPDDVGLLTGQARNAGELWSAPGCTRRLRRPGTNMVFVVPERDRQLGHLFGEPNGYH